MLANGGNCVLKVGIRCVVETDTIKILSDLLHTDL